MNKKSIRMILGVSLNVIVIAVGVFIIFTAGSKAYTFGHNIFDEEAVSSEAQARETQVTISEWQLRLSSLQSSFMTKDL